MTRIFDLLLRLYPPDQRDLFADEMRRVFIEELEEYRKLARCACCRFVLREWAGLLADAGMEWMVSGKAADGGPLRAFLRTGVSVWGGAFVAALGQFFLYATLLHWR